MARAYAVNDFEAIRTRVAEIRRERSGTPDEKRDVDSGGRRIRLNLAPGKRLIKDLVIVRRVRGVGDFRIWPSKC
jgi:hypothetical protein